MNWPVLWDFGAGKKEGTGRSISRAEIDASAAWRVLEWRRMHAMFFETKRAYHATLRIVRRPLKGYGLTSARFDLLGFIHAYESVRQSKLWRALGVTPATVSRMVKSLVALGWVRTRRDPSDRRQRIVELTEDGLARMRAALECFGHVGRRILDRAFGERRLRGKKLRNIVFQRMCNYHDLLHCIRTMCGDTAWLQLHYRWHPDD